MSFFGCFSLFLDEFIPVFSCISTFFVLYFPVFEQILSCIHCYVVPGNAVSRRPERLKFKNFQGLCPFTPMEGLTALPPDPPAVLLGRYEDASQPQLLPTDVGPPTSIFYFWGGP